MYTKAVTAPSPSVPIKEPIPANVLIPVEYNDAL